MPGSNPRRRGVQDSKILGARCAEQTTMALASSLPETINNIDLTPLLQNRRCSCQDREPRSSGRWIHAASGSSGPSVISLG